MTIYYDWDGYSQAKNKTLELIEKASTLDYSVESRQVFAEAAKAAATLALAASQQS